MADKKDMVQPWEKLGIGPTGIGQIPNLLDIIWEMSPRMTMCMVGETGIGKTPIVHQWCEKKSGYMRVLNFGHMTQEEISMIMFSEQGDSFDFVPPQFLLDLNEKAEEHGCAVLFLDEWNRGDKALVNALFTLTDDRRIHNFRLHDNVIVIAAMNPSDGSYLVNEAEKDHAIRKRLNFVYATHDLTAWLRYTKESGWHPLVPAFIKSANTFLYDTGARDAGKCFPCPSNWEKVSRIMEGADKAKISLSHNNVRTLVEGQIGGVAANKFMAFVEDQNTLIQPGEVLNTYKLNSKVRNKVAALLGAKINKEGVFVHKDGKRNRAGTINELNEGIALELFSSMPDAKKIAGHLALYIGDLDPQLLQTFAAQHLLEHSMQHGSEGEKYMQKLNTALRDYAPYKAKMKVIAKAMQDYKKKAGIIKDRDPSA